MKRVLACLVVMTVAGVAAAKCPELAREVLSINGKNDEWKATGLTLEKGDVVLIDATGKVKVGAWIGEVTADGTPSEGLGRLEYKIGDGGAVLAGAHFFLTSDAAGALKLRVRDTKYTDNDGAYVVTVTRIPAGALPVAKGEPAAPATAQQGE